MLYFLGRKREVIIKQRNFQINLFTKTRFSHQLWAFSFRKTLWGFAFLCSYKSNHKQKLGCGL